MNASLLMYPKIRNFISQLKTPSDNAFLCEYSLKDEYGFWPHFEYFLLNLERFENSSSVLKKLSLPAPMSMNKDDAWGKWREFRSAQVEITAIYIIEKIFKGNVLEIVPEDEKPTPDLRVNLNDQELFVEIKAQSGQQHGDKHPRVKDSIITFDPKDEEDLESWLFTKRKSSRNGKLMQPKILEADNQGAHILLAVTDYFKSIDDVEARASIVCPNCKLIATKNIESQPGVFGAVYFFLAKFPLHKELKQLKEIWLFDESNLNEIFVLFQEGCSLLNHLNGREERIL